MFLRGATIAFLFSLVLVACGGDDSSDGEPTSTRPSPTDTTAAAPATSTSDATGGEAPGLAGTTWNVTEYTLPNGSLTQLWPNTEITIAFDTDVALSGSGGCNTYQGTYEVTGGYDEFEDGVRDPNDGQAMTVTDLSFTEMACLEPSNVMEQEAEYFDALLKVGRWVIVRGALSLRDTDGFVLIFADPIG